MPDLLRHVNKLQGTRAATWMSSLPLTMRAYQATRAVLVRDRVRFAVSEMLARPGIYAYRLRDDSATVVLRHDVPDVIVLDELFWWGFYDPPDAVARRLDGAAAERPLRAVDLGANVGLFGVLCVSRWPGAQITALEPDPDNAAVCARAIAANGAAATWQLIEACAGTQPGSAHFAGGQGAQSHVVDHAGPDIRTVPTVDVLPLMADADVVKIDIEGSEWPLLADPRLALVAGAVLLEYHPTGAPTGDPHGDAERLMRAAGFTEYTARHMPDEHGIAWAWRAP